MIFIFKELKRNPNSESEVVFVNAKYLRRAASNSFTRGMTVMVKNNQNNEVVFLTVRGKTYLGNNCVEISYNAAAALGIDTSLTFLSGQTHSTVPVDLTITNVVMWRYIIHNLNSTDRIVKSTTYLSLISVFNLAYTIIGDAFSLVTPHISQLLKWLSS